MYCRLFIEGSDPDMDSIKVLIVDDSMFFREILARGLMNKLPAGSRIEKAGEPFEARDKILSFDPDVMVLDVEMPQMNGIEFLRRLIVQYALPTVVLSSRPAYKTLAMEAGAFTFLEKPSTTLGSSSFVSKVAAEIKLAREYGQRMAQNDQVEQIPQTRTEQMARYAAKDNPPKPVAYEIVDGKATPVYSNSRPSMNDNRAASFTSRTSGAGTSVGTGAGTKQPSLHSSFISRFQEARYQSSQQSSLNEIKSANDVIANNMSSIVRTMKQMSEENRRFRVPYKEPPPPSEGQLKTAVPTRPVKLIAIGASTGGTEALSTVLKALAPPLPPIVIVQHIPPMFSRLFAERLNNECAISVKEAEDGDPLRDNWAYVAPGDKQMMVKVMGDMMTLDVNHGPKVNGHCPSVDVLFNSVAERVGNKAMGAILTGMGEDGARGLLKMRDNGSVTLGQDEASCVVYGMPRAAYEKGAVVQQVPLSDMARMITNVARHQGGK